MKGYTPIENFSYLPLLLQNYIDVHVNNIFSYYYHHNQKLNELINAQTKLENQDISSTLKVSHAEKEEDISNGLSNGPEINLTQSNLKTFKCEIQECGKVYTRKENLILHTKNKHERVKPYKCEYCHLEFSHRNGK